MGEAELRDRDRVGEAELERQGQCGGKAGTDWEMQTGRCTEKQLKNGMLEAGK